MSNRRMFSAETSAVIRGGMRDGLIFALVAEGFGNPSELAAFVADWLGCIDPGNENCSHPWE